MMALLAAKDAAQASLEHDMEAAGSALEGMRNSLEGMGAQLEASEARVVELLEGRQGVRESARAQAQELQRALEEAREARDAAEKRAHVAENDKAALQVSWQKGQGRIGV